MKKILLVMMLLSANAKGQIHVPIVHVINARNMNSYFKELKIYKEHVLFEQTAIARLDTCGTLGSYIDVSKELGFYPSETANVSKDKKTAIDISKYSKEPVKYHLIHCAISGNDTLKYTYCDEIKKPIKPVMLGINRSNTKPKIATYKKAVEDKYSKYKVEYYRDISGLIRLDSTKTYLTKSK